MNSKKCRPIGENLFLPSKLYDIVSNRISGLLFRSGPLAIRWLIMAVPVFSLNGQSNPPCGFHIGKEVFKFVPSVADLNPSPTVAMKTFMFLVKASTHHCSPAFVDWKFPFSGRVTMNRFSFSGSLPLKATTGPRVTARQLGIPHDALIAAITLAIKKPCSVSRFFGGITQNGQSCELSSNEINHLTFLLA